MTMINKSFTGIVIRPMEIDDLKKVLEIEKQSFPVPWTYDLFFSELTRNRYARYFVLEKDKRIIGYLGFWLMRDNIHITNIAIAEKFQRRGYGGKLLKFVEEEAIVHKIKKISLEVRKSNCIAQDMYRKYGYKVMRVLRNYYQEEKEDALVMEKKLS
ncbi:ribosomal protein S18-alanine N-acetyltransferase [bacterium]|nr:ribosomal protein S18-alanine N-acetyltransferase [bacterium]MBU1427514.1 ribosomal protein S18-alanine N-acetyltransferase [bacterium]MBU2440134.1 ribosomal protein S18-alanine N-acetyltransferase [bacterium]